MLNTTKYLQLYKKIIKGAIIALVSIFTLSCSWQNHAMAKKKLQKEEDVEIESPNLEYLRAVYKLSQLRTLQSKEKLAELETKYPSSERINQIIANQVLSLYLSLDYEEVVLLTDTFLKEKPQNAFSSYMLYMKAMAHYNQIGGNNKSLIEAQWSLLLFRKLAQKPSIYQKEALEKVQFLEYFLISYDLNIAMNYQKNNDHIAAMSSYTRLLQKTLNIKMSNNARIAINSILPILYFKMAECFHDIGLDQDAKYYQKLAIDSVKTINSYYPFAIEGVIFYKGSDEYQKSPPVVGLSKKNKNKLLRAFKKQRNIINNAIMQKTNEFLKQQKAEKKVSKRMKKAKNIDLSSEEDLSVQN